MGDRRACQGSAWGDISESLLNEVLDVAGPGNRAAVNLVNRKWRSQHAEVVHHLCPSVWDTAWISNRFPKLHSLVLKDHDCRRPGKDKPGVEVGDKDLIGLSSLTALQALALKSTPEAIQRDPITSNGMCALAASVTGLVALRMDHCQMTGSAASALGNLTTLQCLHLKEQESKDQHLSHISRLTKLTSLYLEGCCIGNLTVTSLQPLLNLKTLCISSSRVDEPGQEVQVTDEALKTLKVLPCLEALDLDCCSHVDGSGLVPLTNLKSLGLSKLKGLTRDGIQAALAALTGLTGLDLMECGHLLGAEGLELWQSPITSLTSLRLYGMLAWENFEGWHGGVFLLEPSFLHMCPGLTDLNLSNSSYTHSGAVATLASLAKHGHLSSLHTLWMSSMEDDEMIITEPVGNLTDHGLSKLASLTSLRLLCLSGNQSITCLGLSHLVTRPPTIDDEPGTATGLHQLQELDLTNCRSVRDMGVSWLALHLTNMRVLSLAACSVTDYCLPHLSRLAALQELSLRGCREITSQGLSSLSALQALQHLHLGHTLSFDATLDDSPRVKDSVVDTLVRMQSLQVLSLEGCREVTAAAASRLLCALSGLTALDLRVTKVPSNFRHSSPLHRDVMVKVGMRDLLDADARSDLFDLIGRPMLRHCVNPPHDWTGACHMQPCSCTEVWQNNCEVLSHFSG